MFWERLFCSSDVELPKGFHYDPDVDMSGYIPLSKRMKASNVVPVSVAGRMLGVHIRLVSRV